MSNERMFAGQLVLTSSTPPGNVGLYAKDDNTIGVVGDIVCVNPRSDVESPVVIATSNPLTNVVTISAGDLVLENTLMQLQRMSVKLPKWRAAVAKVMNGSGNAKLLCIGDSTTLGSGSTGVTGYGASGYAKNKTAKIAARLSAIGIPAKAQGTFGSGNIGTLAQYGVFDPRWSGDAAWTGVALPGSLGKFAWRNNTNTAVLSFHPEESVDTFKVFYSKSTFAASFDLYVNAGAHTNYDCWDSVDNSTAIATITASLGDNTLNIARTTSGHNATGSVYILGVRAYNSAQKHVEVIQSGCSGSKVADYMGSTNPWTATVIMRDFLMPDLTVICLGINDWVAGTDLGTWKTNLQTLISAALATGDVILTTPPPSSTSIASAELQQSYIDAAILLANTNGLLYVDVFGRLVDYDTANGLGLMVDTSHPNGVGYSDCVAAEFPFISAVV